MPIKTRPVFPALPTLGYLGSYQLSASGLTATTPGAGATSFSFQWAPPAGQLCVITAVDLRIIVATVITVQPVMGFVFARGFTAPDTGGTALTGPFSKRTSYPTSLVADVRAATAASLTPGTRTPDSTSFFIANASPVGSVTQTQGQPTTWGIHHPDPIILAANEGLLLNNIVAQGSGTYQYFMRMEWFEVRAGSL